MRQAEVSAKQLKRDNSFSPSESDLLGEIMPDFDPQANEIENKLEETLKTKVILKRRGAKGVIAINFNSPEEMTAIIRKIIGEQGMAEF